MDLSRRTFLKRTLQATVAVGVIYPSLVEPFRHVVEKVTVQIDRLPPQFAGFRIVQLSDLHYQPFTTMGQIEHIIEVVNALQPDLVVITGDFVTHRVDSIHDLAKGLGRLRAPHGICGVMGNHDHRAGSGVITTALRNSGLEILRNQGRSLTHQGASIYLAGIDSACNARPDLAAALVSRPATAIPTILLAHEPDYIDFGPAAAGVDLQLSGHSHGGQVCLPLIGAPHLPEWGRKYWHGLHRVGHSQVYTNRGIGTIGLPIRFGSLPEITEITLAPKSVIS